MKKVLLICLYPVVFVAGVLFTFFAFWLIALWFGFHGNVIDLFNYPMFNREDGTGLGVFVAKCFSIIGGIIASTIYGFWLYGEAMK